MDDIAARLGITSTALYRHYPLPSVEVGSLQFAPQELAGGVAG
ncbi:hypothetical protein IU476_00390 [Nocardia blacklockiae]|nr:hypothetical protein [Nocardia blacklockiae]